MHEEDRRLHLCMKTHDVVSKEIVAIL